MIYNFLKNIKCNIVIFTSNDLLNYFLEYKKYNKNIYIIIKELIDIPLYKKYINIWDYQYLIDTTERSIKKKYSYIICNSKLNFLKEVIEINPFNSIKFVWNDINIIRNYKDIIYLKNYNNNDNISTNKIDIVLINEIHESKKFYFNEKYFSTAIFGSDINTLLKYHTLYYNKLDEYLDNNQFIGCDKQITTSIYIENKNIFNLLNTNDRYNLIKYYNKKKYVIVKPNGRLGNTIIIYLASILLCMKYNYEYILYDDYIKLNKEEKDDYIFIKGYDHLGDDILYNNSKNIDIFKNISNEDNNIVGFNTLGYFKKSINIDKLVENKYINTKNEHGIYIKNNIIIDDNNYFEYYSRYYYNDIYCRNIFMNGFFQFNDIYLENKNKILNYIEENKHKHYIMTNNGIKYLIKDIIDDIKLDDSKIYNIVIHIRLGDFNDRVDYIEYKYLENLFNKIDFKNKKICILSEKIVLEKDIEYINNIKKWFEINNIKIFFESNDLLIDFNIMKQCKILICGMSTLSWMAAYLSKSIELCIFPNYNFYKINDRQNSYFKKPINNTLLYDVKTTIKYPLKVIILSIKNKINRINRMEKIIYNFSKIGLEYEIYYGVNGNDIKIYDTEHNNIKLLYNNFETYYYDNRIRRNNIKMKNGEFGCAWSHLKIYKKLLNDNNYQYYLILEDDANLVTSLNTLYETINNLPEIFDICHLSKSIWNPFNKLDKINDYFYNISINYFNCLVSLIISKSGASKILKLSNNHINIPADDLVCETYLKNRDFKLYVPENNLFDQFDNTISIINNILE